VSEPYLQLSLDRALELDEETLDEALEHLVAARERWARANAAR
jgi:hypothetical protein